jgi:hypothetical protein
MQQHGVADKYLMQGVQYENGAYLYPARVQRLPKSGRLRRTAVTELYRSTCQSTVASRICYTLITLSCCILWPEEVIWLISHEAHRHNTQSWLTLQGYSLNGYHCFLIQVLKCLNSNIQPCNLVQLSGLYSGKRLPKALGTHLAPCIVWP